MNRLGLFVVFAQLVAGEIYDALVIGGGPAGICS